MTEESSNEKTISPEKLLIDNPSDFRFHAAYLTYADVYDKVTSSEARKQLNRDIMALKQNEIDYSTFYKSINQYRSGEGFQLRCGIVFVKTQRKREWGSEMQKKDVVNGTKNSCV